LRHTVDDRADQVRQAEGLRHVGIHRPGNLPEVVEVLVGEKQRLQLAGFASFANRGHQMHADSSTLGESPEGKSLPWKLKIFSG